MLEKWRKKRRNAVLKKQTTVLVKLCESEELDLEAIIAESDKMLKMIEKQ